MTSRKITLMISSQIYSEINSKIHTAIHNKVCDTQNNSYKETLNYWRHLFKQIERQTNGN